MVPILPKGGFKIERLLDGYLVEYAGYSHLVPGKGKSARWVLQGPWYLKKCFEPLKVSSESSQRVDGNTDEIHFAPPKKP